jgi:hypothetical protein
MSSPKPSASSPDTFVEECYYSPNADLFAVEGYNSPMTNLFVNDEAIAAQQVETSYESISGIKPIAEQATDNFEEEARYEPQRSIFEIFESSYFYEDEINDQFRVVQQIHQAVHLSLESVRLSSDQQLASPNVCVKSKANDPTISPEKRQPVPKSHRNAEELKDFAYSLSPIAFMKGGKLCNQKCCFQSQACIPNATIGQVAHIQTEYWGEIDLEAPKNNQRKVKNEALFEKAFYKQEIDEFLFDIGTPGEESKYVCEHAYLRLCGISNLDSKSDAPDQWKVGDTCMSYLA